LIAVEVMKFAPTGQPWAWYQRLARSADHRLDSADARGGSAEARGDEARAVPAASSNGSFRTVRRYTN
jgi:hypothetical protein